MYKYCPFQVTACLTELLRDNFRNTKVKQVALPALGEVLHLLARMEEARGCSLEQWSVPSITYTLVTRCLRESVSIHSSHLKLPLY